MKSNYTVLKLIPCEGLSSTYNWVIKRLDVNKKYYVDLACHRRGVSHSAYCSFLGIVWAEKCLYNKLDCLAVKLGSFWEVEEEVRCCWA